MVYGLLLEIVYFITFLYRIIQPIFTCCVCDSWITKLLTYLLTYLLIYTEQSRVQFRASWCAWKQKNEGDRENSLVCLL